MEKYPMLESIISIIQGILSLVIGVFMIFYLFFWKRLRRWFNKKAGVDFMPQRRLETPQYYAILGGGALGLVFFILSMIGKDTDIISTILNIAFVGWLIIICIKIQKEKNKKQAFYVSLYLLLSCMAILCLAALIGGFAIAACIILFLVDKFWDYGMESLHGQPTGDNSFIDDSGRRIECGQLNNISGYCKISFQKCDCLDHKTCPYNKST